jgi:hypothetical protein
MGIGTILLIILILLLVGALPAWPYSSGWGYCWAGYRGAALFVNAGRHARGRAPVVFRLVALAARACINRKGD